MQEYTENYRGYAISPCASGPGPLKAFYTIWELSPNSNYTAVLQGLLSDEFETIESACSAAVIEAKEKLDSLLAEK